ncbi:Ger(x)C family spore germination protein [Paenibacillus sp. HJL G12]|uniref:Ger(X)C family spore germination protein n=1 Tax=Paenibacillus dendrobii TaxID=2691084 RepID=A0A7X3IKN4_9BACL|nr:Ger(x)C family spore germination protein [Paenibacillus dendrobii]MWV45693.1 Ger(x)C family spore germination protein [Paenibacillus dendrobii]
MKHKALIVGRIAALLGILQMLCGCWDRTEINDMALVTAAAIDKDERDGIELSLQVFMPRALGSNSGGSQGGGGQKLTLVRSSRGQNIADAVSKIQTKLPRKVFWGHCKVFVLGEEFARKGVREEMDFLARHPQPRERAYMFVSKGKAIETLNLLPPLERYSADMMRKLSELKIGLKVTMKDFIIMLGGDSKAAALPMLDILPPEEGEQPSQGVPYIAGTAVFKEDKLIGDITLQTTRGVLWLTKKMEKATITVRPKDAKSGFITINPNHHVIHQTPRIVNGKWQVLLSIQTSGDLVQNGTNWDPMNLDLLHAMEAAVQDSIKDKIELALDEVQKTMKADILGFAEDFHRSYPRQWGRVKNRWDEVYPTIQVKTDIHVNIRRPGLSTVPVAIPEDEVKKK